MRAAPTLRGEIHGLGRAPREDHFQRIRRLEKLRDGGPGVPQRRGGATRPRVHACGVGVVFHVKARDRVDHCLSSMRRCGAVEINESLVRGRDGGEVPRCPRRRARIHSDSLRCCCEERARRDRSRAGDRARAEKLPPRGHRRPLLLKCWYIESNTIALSARRVRSSGCLAMMPSSMAANPAVSGR